MHDVILQDDGQGVYIKSWNLADPEPSQADLDKWALEFDLQHRQQQAVQARQYPSIQEQLDMQYHDAKNGTKLWFDSIQAIKDANPKPQA